VFGQPDYNPDEYPESAALRNFLSERSDSLRDKRLVVLAFRAPYYLDTTEISKLTAYFGVYGTNLPFLEMAVRALFREFAPTGAPPVSVPGINYDLIRQLEPDPGQVISLSPIGPAEVISGSIQVGSQIELEAGIILDRKGHPVPDGTPVEFELVYPTEGLALAPQIETTAGGKARTIVALDRAGELWITAQAGEARNSTRIQLKVMGLVGQHCMAVPTGAAYADCTIPTADAHGDHHRSADCHSHAASAAASASASASSGIPGVLLCIIGDGGSSGSSFLLDAMEDEIR
jgi:beta-N-acetylhexosaminidase